MIHIRDETADKSKAFSLVSQQYTMRNLNRCGRSVYCSAQDVIAYTPIVLPGVLWWVNIIPHCGRRESYN